MKKLFLNWDNIPVVLFITNAGLPRAAFMKNDPFNAWKPVNPLQVWEEGRPITRKRWNLKFKRLAVEKLPKAKDFKPENAYTDTDTSWYPPDHNPDDEPIPVEKAEDEEEKPQPLITRLEWDASEIEIEN